MKFQKTPLKDACVIELSPIFDDRGLFVRSFCKEELSACGLKKEIVQINQSITQKKGTFRGFHYQLNPYSETKIVRCISGSVFDIIIDIRQGSPTFMQSYGIELSEKNFKMIYIPEGFAHGFQTLTDNCILMYLHTEYYTASNEAGLNYKDSLLNIQLPLPLNQISDKDNNYKFLNSNFKGL